MRALIAEFGPRVRATLARNLRQASPEQLDQAIADAALTMWQHIDRYQSESGTLSGYFYSIARNCLVSALRAQACRPLFQQMESEHLDNLSGSTDAVARPARIQALLELLRACIGKLSPKQQDIVLSDLANQSGEPIGASLAERWATSTNAIRVARNRAHHRLQELMELAVRESQGCREDES